MSGEKDTLKIIDETINAVQGIPNILETAKKELMNIKNDKEKLESEKTQLEREKTQLELDKKKLEAETKQLEKDKQERDQKIGQMTEEQMRLLDEYAKVKEELKKFAKIAAEMEEHELSFDRIQALLSIYSVLLEKIFQGQPHFRILYVLHGQKEEMTRDEIKNTTGIQGAMVLRAVQELDRVDLVEYDMDTSKAKLKKRLFPKPVEEG